MTPLRTSLLLVAVLAAVPVLGAIGSDITIPAAGYLDLPDDLTYRTELVITNHRDVLQYVEFSLIWDGHRSPMTIFPLQPRETKFLPSAGLTSGTTSLVGALRIRTLDGFEGGDDALGRIEANVFIIADRGKGGSSRQELTGIPSNEYTADEAWFLGVRHSPDTGARCNVGITNLDPVQTVTFYVRYQYKDPMAVVVPPLQSRQVRIQGGGNGGRWVHVYPEWSVGDGEPAHRTEWVAYASTVDGITGDAFSGMRVPATSVFVAPQP